MFFVLNKQKIYTYVISIITVIFLFCIANSITNNKENTVQTSSTIGKLLPIYNVQTEEKKVALTMNCACLQLLMGQN